MYFLWDFRYCGKPPREITRFEEVAPPRRSGRSRRRPPPEALPPPGSAAFSPGLCRPHPLGAGGRWRIPDPPRAGRSSRVRRRPATPVRCSADSGRWRSPQPESPRSPGTPGLLPRCRLSGRNRRRKPPVPFDDTVFSAPPANERTAPGSHGRRTASGASFGRSVPARRNTRRSSPHRTLSQRPGRNATPAAFGASGESRRRTGFRPGSSLHTTSLSRRTSPSIISPTILEMVILLKPVLTTRSRRVRHAPVATMRRTNPRLSRLLSPLFFPAFSSMTCPFPRCLSNLPCRSSPPAFFICLLYDAPRGPSRKTAPPPGGAV